MNSQEFERYIEKFGDRRYKKKNLISALINRTSQEEILKKCFTILDNPMLYTPKTVYGTAILLKEL